jgi:plastocyanin
MRQHRLAPAARATALAVAAAALAPAAARPEAPGDIRGEVVLVRRSAGSQAKGPGDVVVYLEDAPAVGPMPRSGYVVEQVGKTFDPQVLVVPVGATVEFPNHDIYHHNIFSLSPAKHFDLGLYEPGATRSVTFDKPGLVSLYCNIHPQMLGYVLVVSNPFHTRPAEGGAFSLRGVPPGSYHLVAWFPFGPAVREVVRVTPGGSTRVKVVVRERAHASRHTPGTGSADVAR